MSRYNITFLAESVQVDCAASNQVSVDAFEVKLDEILDNFHYEMILDYLLLKGDDLSVRSEEVLDYLSESDIQEYLENRGYTVEQG